MRRSGWVVLAGGFAVCAVCVGLGIWQLRRHGETRDWIAAMELRMAAPAVPLAEALSAPGGAGFRRVVAQGRYALDETVLLLHQRRELVSGVRAITPLLVPGRERGILIDRGFVPAADAEALIESERGERAVRVEGVLRELGERALTAGEIERRRDWHVLHRTALERQIGQALEPWLLVRAGDEASGPPFARAPAPRSAVNHVYYAIQWLAIAALAPVVATAFVLRSRSSGAGPDAHP